MGGAGGTDGHRFETPVIPIVPAFQTKMASPKLIRALSQQLRCPAKWRAFHAPKGCLGARTPDWPAMMCIHTKKKSSLERPLRVMPFNVTMLLMS
ncbi:hypothetical protein GGE12_005616 [Rhizobium mongolense]|uniref:Uncharacterized protein n=1 Tax=Rhizobium mongolense TaxID=57676 RepID=A0A7W6WGS7_9HYPH|nr:hypothetical protein [Rhizobium mongolense]